MGALEVASPFWVRWALPAYVFGSHGSKKLNTRLHTHVQGKRYPRITIRHVRRLFYTFRTIP